MKPAADAAAPASPRLWIERLTLTDFRNYASLTLALGPEPIVLTGANGAGKTNLLEAVSLLAPGQGLRRAPYPELARIGGTGGGTGCGTGEWAVAARLNTRSGPLEVGTGLGPAGTQGRGERTGRIVRIDRQTVSGSGALAEHVEMVWLVPAMDGLFTGPAGERRRFLDRLILCFDPGYRVRLGAFERAMRQRNRLLESNDGSATLLEGLELQLAETGVAIAAARAEAVAALSSVLQARKPAAENQPFPRAEIALEGSLEAELADSPAVEVEDGYRRRLASGRERDRAAARTLEGPHRSDLLVGHGPKAMPARLCSTGEQKALLVGLVLAHAEMVAGARGGTAPILLLDEIAAHLDEIRRQGLFDEVLRLGSQAWMTGTDSSAFASLGARARCFVVEEGQLVEQ